MSATISISSLVIYTSILYPVHVTLLGSLSSKSLVKKNVLVQCMVCSEQKYRENRNQCKILLQMES